MATLLERFNKKWVPNRDTNCWEWTASTVGGYGCIGDGRGNILRAHRVSWYLHKGDIPHGICVLHHCDNRKCVNPEHLFLGTKKDNSDDMIRKGRSRHPPQNGIMNGMSKLDRADIEFIRTSNEGPVALGKTFGVHYRHIWAIRKGLRWR